MVQKNPLKPAVVLDDSPSIVTPIAHGLRVFAGVDVEHYFSIPAFERKYGMDQIEINDHAGRYRACADALKQYSVLVCDNNFRDHEDPEHPYDGWATGIDFLRYTVGPALQLLPPEERPLIVCYAPSNRETIMGNRGVLEENGIISFLKTQEDICVGLYVAIAHECGYAPNYHTFVTDVLGFTEEEMDRGQKGFNTLFDLAIDYDIYSTFLGEKRDTVAGIARPVGWGVIEKELSKRLGLSEKGFERRIQELIQRNHPEGVPPAFKK